MSKHKTEVTFIERNGRTLSKRTSYYDNGQVAEIGVYGHSQSDWSWSIPVGPIKRYFESGQLQSELIYNDLGVREGEWLFYNQEGKLLKKIVYSNDKLVEEISHEDERVN